MNLLSILIPTIPGRHAMFTALFNELQRQIAYCETVHSSIGKVEVLVDPSERFLEGGLSIGKKREELVKRASGKYLCFLDDDEMISPDYIETLLRLCKNNCDVVTFNSFVTLGQYWMLVRMSLEHKKNNEAKPGIINRMPWHMCPVRSVYAKAVGFEDSNYSEDWNWMEKVLQMCRTESRTDAILHNYRHGTHSEADKITQHDLASTQGQ